MNFQKQTLAVAFAVAGLISGAAYSAPSSYVWLPPEAVAIVALAATNHPGVAAARHSFEASVHDISALESFYAPSFSSAIGFGKGPSSAPETGLSPYLSENASGVQGGLLLPVRGGAYIGAGLAQRRLDSALPDGGAAWQSVAGARMSVPLLRDRGFATQKAREQVAAADSAAMSCAVDSVVSDVCHASARAFAYELYAAALFDQHLKALYRVTSLQTETAERVKLRTMAAYQVFPAEMEVQFKFDDVRQAAAVYTNAHNSLELSVGGVSLPYLKASLLGEWATACATADVSRITAERGSIRPEVLQAHLAVQASEARERELAQSVRSDLSFSAGVGYRGENPDFGFGNDNLLSDEKAGVDAAIVWSRPLSFDAEDAKFRAARARTASLRNESRRIEIAVAAECREAEALFKSAVDRLETVSRAVDLAEKVLQSEADRLGLGEGSSRNVLDAQTDLTSAEGRANLAAYDVVCSFLDLMLALGVDLLPDGCSIASGAE